MKNKLNDSNATPPARGTPVGKPRGTPKIRGTPEIKLRDGPIIRTRGKPPEVKIRGIPPSGNCKKYPVFHRAKLFEMGEVCETDLSAYAVPANVGANGREITYAVPDNVALVKNES